MKKQSKRVVSTSTIVVDNAVRVVAVEPRLADSQ